MESSKNNTTTTSTFTSNKIKKQSKRKYNKISNTQRRAIIDSYVDGEDYLEVARSLNIKQSTARAIVKIYEKEFRKDKKKVGGYRGQKRITPEIEDLIEDILSEDVETSLKEIRDRIIEDFPDLKAPSISTIARYLDGKFFTSPNSFESTICEDEMKLECNGKYVVFMDVIKFYAWNRRVRNKSRMKKEEYSKVMDSKIAVFNIIIAMNPQLGLIHHQYKRGIVTAEYINEFVKHVSNITKRNDLLFIMNNDRAITDKILMAALENPIQFIPTSIDGKMG